MNTSASIPLGEALLELTWPTRCAGCERPGALLCEECRTRLLYIAGEHACERCGAPFGRLVCTECYSADGLEHHAFEYAVCAVELEELAGRAVVLYKDNNEHRLAEVFAELMVAALPSTWPQWAEVLTWVPSDRKAVRRRGFDHMERLAAAIAGRIGLKAVPLLVKRPVSDQRGLNRAERAENLRTAFSVPVSAPPARILLLDDVFTTGTTLDTATTVLKEAGAREVRVLTLARVW